MGQFCFSCTLPLCPLLVFLQKGKGPAWCCLSGCERSSDHAGCPFPLKQGVHVGNNVMYMWERCFFHLWSADDPVCICWLWAGFIPPHTDTQLWCPPAGTKGCAQEACCPQRWSRFPLISFRPPVLWQPSSPPIVTCGTLGSKCWTRSPVLAAVFPGWRGNSGNNVCF